MAIVAALAALALVGLWTGGVLDGGAPSASGDIETLTIKGETFHLELAVDPAAIERGLMHRESIPEDGGMLFVFDDVGYHNFWMKNCLVDIDVMFLDDAGRVDSTHEMAAEPPRREDETEAEYEARLERYESDGRVRFAIELKAGTLDRLGIEPGDRIDLDLSRLKRMAR